MAGRSSRIFNTYHRLTRTATYGFIAALPLFILYEFFIRVVNAGRTAGVRVGAEVWIKQIIPLPGRMGMLLMLGVVLIIGLGVVYYERRKHIPIYPKYLAWMVLESAVYAVIVAILVSNIVGAIFAMDLTGAGQPSLALQVVLSIGAGLYEELFFRVLLVGGLYALLHRLMRKDTAAYLVAALVGALIFSAVHYIGALGDPFTLPSFMFRFFFGLVLNAIYLVRGFGVAAWTHAIYDVFVVTHLLG